MRWNAPPPPANAAEAAAGGIRAENTGCSGALPRLGLGSDREQQVIRPREAALERKLRAILSADVVGYSRLMAADDEGTLARLNACLDGTVSPAISGHRGRIVKLMGDGILAEFESVVDAVRCAVAVQEAMATAGAGAPADGRIEWRIGVDIGDVIVEGDDIYGDGVNVAARMQELADPGGILISGDAHNQVRGKLDFEYDDLGAQSLKNIPEPVTAYRVTTGGMRPAPKASKKGGRLVLLTAAVAALAAVAVAWGYLAPRPQTGETTATAERAIQKSIAVLPFDNMSVDPQQEYFADGMAEDIITDLSKISGLFVIARNSSFAYKSQSPDVREVGRELGVGYVVEGSVRKAGGRIRINVQLIDASSGHHIWAERYDREEKDIFELQDEVREKVVASLKVKLTPDEETRLAGRLTDSPEAYDLWLRGLRHEGFSTKEDNLASRRFFEQAIEIDPGFAAAHASLANAYGLAVENGWSPSPVEHSAKSIQFAERSVRLDDDLPRAHWALARALSRKRQFNGERAVTELEKAISLDPNNADAYALLSEVLTFTGRAEEAVGKMERAMRLNPRSPYWYLHILGRSQLMLGRYDVAVGNLEKAVERNSNVPWPRRYLIAAYGQLGRLDDAEWELEELRAQGYEVSLNRFLAMSNIQDTAYLKHYADGLRKAGVRD